MGKLKVENVVMVLGYIFESPHSFSCTIRLTMRSAADLRAAKIFLVSSPKATTSSKTTKVIRKTDSFDKRVNSFSTFLQSPSSTCMGCLT